ncbi:MAG: DUF721 domain-containing protein [Treponema sp.]|nr:DUF721 domain-containing protein [Candidatus Treponema merdequi]
MNDVISSNEMINRVFSNISVNTLEENTKIANAWEETISRIYNYGSKLAGHSKIVDIKNGILLIESDHPGWNQILQNNKSFILKGLKMIVPDVNVRNLAFRVKGSEATLGDDYETYLKKSRENMLKNIENDEKKLEEMGFKHEKSTQPVPDEVKKLFEGIL